VSDYSPDVEIDETGKLVYAREVALGEVITMPLHMFSKIGSNPAMSEHIVRTCLPGVHLCDIFNRGFGTFSDE
jgi:hypothetical protein